MNPKSNIILGDSFELLKSMADKSVDLALCDCPYGIDICSSGRLIKEKGRQYKAWDKQAPSTEFFSRAFKSQQERHHFRCKPFH